MTERLYVAKLKVCLNVDSFGLWVSQVRRWRGRPHGLMRVESLGFERGQSGDGGERLIGKLRSGRQLGTRTTAKGHAVLRENWNGCDWGAWPGARGWWLAAAVTEYSATPTDPTRRMPESASAVS